MIEVCTLDRKNIIKKIKENNKKMVEIEKNINIWKEKAKKLKQERVILDEKLYKLDNKQLF